MQTQKIIISTESACELTAEQIDNLGVKIVKVRHYLDGEEMTNSNLSMAELYGEMQKGKRLTTSQVNEFEYMEHFESILEQNADCEVVHIGFSSGLSGMHQSSLMSLENLKPEFRDKVHIVDSKNGSLALGLLVILTSNLAKEGANTQEIIQVVQDMKDHISTIITASELKYLYMSGRLNKLTAFVGGLLNIKPIFKVDNDGKFSSVGKTLNRKKSLLDLLAYFKKNYENYSDCPVFISHAVCYDDAKFLQEKISEMVDVPVHIMDFGPIVGGHSGPGTIAIFYTSSSR